MLKANNIPLKLCNKHAFAGKRISHNILFAFDVFDDTGKRLNELTPLSVTLVNLILTLEILERLMVRVKNQLMRP